ncbi:MAG: insulinase family protein [Melioribacteraceae bacterium]|nr:insulinase family protein [Melioribacteraceae bacterium]
MIRKLSFILIILLSVTVYSQIDRSKVPEPGPAPEIQIGDYESFTLSNGLQVFVVENHKLPRVAFSLVLHRDPVLENENAGYISITGQLLRTATKTRTKDQLDEEIDFIGASISTSPAGVFASSLSKHTEKLLDLMSDVVLNAVFKQEELDKIKKQTISGIKASQDDPNAIANNVRKALLYGKDHPYGEIETEESVNSITIELCKKYYDTFFKPNIAYLAVVGDITSGEAESLIEKYFSAWEKKDVPSFEYKNPRAPLIRKVALVNRPNSVQSVINVTYPINLKNFSEDDIKVSVLNRILGGGMSSRLFRNLREDKAFTYGAYSAFASDRLVGSFRAYCEARNSVTDSAVTEFLNEMRKIRDEKVDADELEAAKNYLIGSFARSLESPQTVASFALNIARYNLPKDYYKNYLKNVQAVTAEDLQQMAKKYIKPNNAYVLVVGKADEVADKLKPFSISGKLDYYDMFGNEYDPTKKALPEGLTAESVIEKAIVALGGKENLEKVIDKKSTLKGEIQGMSIILEIYQKAPDKYYQKFDMGMMKQETWFDGEKGKTVAMGREVPLEGDQLNEMKVEATLNLPLKLAELGITPELTSMEQVDGKDAYVINLNLPSGKYWSQYYDVNSGLLLKQVRTMDSPQGSITVTSQFSDYKEVEGVMYPHVITNSFGPQSITLTLEKIEINIGLDNSVFSVQ